LLTQALLEQYELSVLDRRDLIPPLRVESCHISVT